jgi:hypothetical protein
LDDQRVVLEKEPRQVLVDERRQAGVRQRWGSKEKVNRSLTPTEPRQAMGQILLSFISFQFIWRWKWMNDEQGFGLQQL